MELLSWKKSFGFPLACELNVQKTEVDGGVVMLNGSGSPPGYCPMVNSPAGFGAGSEGVVEVEIPVRCMMDVHRY